MGARVLEFDQTVVLKVGALKRIGVARVTRSVDAVAPSARAAMPAANEPTLLDAYRRNPSAFMERAEREARQARAEEIRAWVHRILV